MDSNTYYASFGLPRKGGHMDNIDCTQAFDQITGSANKLQTICKLAINTSDYNKPDMQTILYIIQDYVSDIKKISDIMA